MRFCCLRPSGSSSASDEWLRNCPRAISRWCRHWRRRVVTRGLSGEIRRFSRAADATSRAAHSACGCATRIVVGQWRLVWSPLPPGGPEVGARLEIERNNGIPSYGEGDFPACAVSENDDRQALVPGWTRRSFPAEILLIGFGQPRHAGRVRRCPLPWASPNGARAVHGGGMGTRSVTRARGALSGFRGR